jgi:hypothetical protein
MTEMQIIDGTIAASPASTAFDCPFDELPCGGGVEQVQHHRWVHASGFTVGSSSEMPCS